MKNEDNRCRLQDFEWIRVDWSFSVEDLVLPLNGSIARGWLHFEQNRCSKSLHEGSFKLWSESRREQCTSMRDTTRLDDLTVRLFYVSVHVFIPRTRSRTLILAGFFIFCTLQSSRCTTKLAWKLLHFYFTLVSNKIFQRIVGFHLNGTDSSYSFHIHWSDCLLPKLEKRLSLTIINIMVLQCFCVATTPASPPTRE